MAAMAAFGKQALRCTGVLGLMGLVSCMSSSAADTLAPQQLSPLDLQSLEYRLDVPERGQVVTAAITFTEFMDSEGFDYGALVYLPTHEVDTPFTLIHHDLNNDGFEDVLVPLMVLPENEQQANNDGGGYFALATVLNQRGQPVHKDTTLFGMVYEVDHDGGQIVVHGATELWGDETTFVHSWTEAGLTEISREIINLDTMPFPDGRDHYTPYDLENSRLGGAVDDPLALVQSVLGTDDQSERPSDPHIQVLESNEQRIVIGYSRQRLGDDSVYARRLRLEFKPEGDQWRIDWIGQQVSCAVGRGRQAWHNELCS